MTNGSWNRQYEVRVWHRGYADWAWEVRTKARASDPLFLPVFASGTETSPKAARSSARNAIEVKEARESAKWTPLRSAA